MSQFYDLNIQGSEVQLRLDLASHNVLAFDGILDVPVVASDALITEAGTYQIVYAPNGGRGEMLLSMGGVYYRHFKLQSEGKTVLDSSWYNTDGQIRRDRLFLNGAARDIYAYAAGAFGKVERDGVDGVDGITPHIDPVTRHWMIGEADTGILARGTDGESAYQTAVNEGYQGTQSEWIASLHGLDGKSAYELWVEQPGNEGKTLNEFFASLKESGFTSKAVLSLPTGSEISENTIYAVPEKSDESLQNPDRWAEYIRKDNSWILLAQHTGAGLGELITNFANLRKEVADMISQAMYADIKNYTSGKIINGDGTISDNEAYCLSEYIPVEYGQKIRFWLGDTTARLNVYNSKRQGLMSDCYKNSSSANPPESATNPRTVTLNANIFTTAAYFRMSFPKSKASEAYAQVLNTLDEVISEWRPEEKVLKSSTQELTKEQISTVLDNLNIRTGVENGNVITFTGKGNTTAWSVPNRVTLIPKHTYRFWLQDTDWSLDGITVSSGYDKLNFFIYNNPDGVLRNEDGLYRINVLNTAVKMTDVVKPYYDYTVPESVEIDGESVEVKEWWLRIYGRAAVGTEVKVRVEDITSLLQATSEADEDSDKTIAERLAEGNAVRLTYNDMIENYGNEVV
jgi:hypothetical protein